MIKDKPEKTKIIKNAAVLKKGIQPLDPETGWGWEHIFTTRSNGINHADQIMKNFNLKNPDEVMDLIMKALKEGSDQGTTPSGLKKIVYEVGQKKLQVLVIEEGGSAGSIHSAYPI